jgi:hypothetical protein
MNHSRRRIRGTSCIFCRCHKDRVDFILVLIASKIRVHSDQISLSYERLSAIRVNMIPTDALNFFYGRFPRTGSVYRPKISGSSKQQAGLGGLRLQTAKLPVFARGECKIGGLRPRIRDDAPIPLVFQSRGGKSFRCYIALGALPKGECGSDRTF